MSRLALIGAAGAAVVILAVGLIYAIGQQEDDDPVETPGAETEALSEAVPGTSAPETAATPSASPTQTATAPAADVPATDVANPAAAPAATDVILPSFDVVRVNPNGDAVIAGRAAPGVDVELLDGGKVIGRAEADDRGEWVVLPDSAIEPGEHKFTLRVPGADGKALESERMVIVVVPEPAKDIAGNAVTEPAGALALSVPQNGDGASQILNLPSNNAEAASGPVTAPTLDVLDFDQKGRMAMSGRAPSEGQVALYLDGNLLGSAPIDEEGRWTFTPETTLPIGPHELRIDQVDDGGKVLGRSVQSVEQPDFAGLSPDGNKLIVQPGNSLWRLARRTYGDGLHFSVIYEANKERIRDPNLIYPGQVFDLPK